MPHAGIVVKVKCKKITYEHVKLSVMPKLCADVPLGHDFLQQQKREELLFEGYKPTSSICDLARSAGSTSIFILTLGFHNHGGIQHERNYSSGRNPKAVE